ncbi:MAG: hypothetical protein O2890_03030 [Cyanobacteria bacterium]|nr:hypothetical protein [Cyanobacteriota bacterium]
MEDFSDLGPGEGWLYMGGDVGGAVEYVLLWLTLIVGLAWIIKEFFIDKPDDSPED